MLHGKPLVAWPITLARSVPSIQRIIVTTDDDEIMAIAQKYGAETPFKRPRELARDETPTLPVLQQCLRYLEESENYKPDIVILLYPTAPFLKKERVEEVFNLFKTTDCQSVLGVVEDHGRFWRYEETHKPYIPFYPHAALNRQLYKPLYRETGSLYASRYSVLMRGNKLIDENNVQFIIMNTDELLDIDTHEDFVKAENSLPPNVYYENR